MGSITLKGVSDALKERLEELADPERRSLSQQAILPLERALVLERALADKPTGFERAYRRFRDEHGPSPFRESPLKKFPRKEGDPRELRNQDEGRKDL